MKLKVIIIIGILLMYLNAFSNEVSQEEKNKAKAYYYFAYAHLLEIQNKLDEALKYYNEALKFDKESAEIKIQIASIYNDKKDYERAIEILKELTKNEPKNVDALKELARNYFDKGYTSKDKKYYQLSIDELEKVREINDLDASVVLNLARLYTMIDNDEKAIEVLESYTKKNPDAYDVQDMLIEIYEKKGSYAEAIRIYEDMLGKGYYSYEYVYRLLNLYAEMGEIGKIDELYEKVKKHNKDKDILIEFALAYITTNESKKAEEVYSFVYKMYPEDDLIIAGYADLIEKNKGELEAIKFLEDHIIRYEMSFEAGYKLGLLYIKNDRWEEADGIISKLINILERKRDEKRDKFLRALYLQKAFIRQKNREYEEAVEFYNKAEKISPIEPRFNLMLAYTYYQLKRYDKALEIADKLSDAKEVKNYVNLLRAEILLAKGEADEAKRLLESVDEIASEDKEYVFLLVELYQLTKEYDKAEDVLIKWINKDPKDIDLLFLLGVIKERQKNYDEAEKYFKEVIKIKPDDPAAFNYLGYMYIDLGMKLEESLEFVKKAVELDSENGAYLDSLGWGYYKLNKLDLAEEYLEKAIKYLPNNPVIFDHLGDVYYKKGKIKEAIKNWQQAIKTKNEEVNLEEIQEKINNAIEEKRK